MAGSRRATGAGRRRDTGEATPRRLFITGGVLLALVLVSLRLLPGSPFESSAAARWGTPESPDTRTTDTAADRSDRPAPAGPAPSPTLPALPLRATEVNLDVQGWYSWSLLDTRTGDISGSANMSGTNTTASLIKAWIVADFLRRSTEKGSTPSDTRLAEATKIIRDSDNTYAEQFYTRVDREASIKRLISICKLTDSKPAADGGWSRTALSARDTARMGACIADERAAGPEWTEWLIDEMRLVRGTGDFGIRKAFPAAERKQIAIKNGWVDRTREQEMHVNCLAIGDGWTMGVMTRYPIALGYDYGMKNCQQVAAKLLAAAE